jgi:hypothetical protein
MRALATGALAAVLWLLVGVAEADEVGADRAAEFVVADHDAAGLIGASQTMTLLTGTGVAVLVAVLLLLLGGARARRSRTLLDRLDSELEGLDD